MRLLKYWPIILLLLLAILPLWPASPVIQQTPPRDSGFFFYVGSRLLKGDLLYKNIWDDKPPMIFLLNALGLWISAGSRWGVWILELVSIWAAVWIAFSVLKKPFGKLPAALGIATGLTILLLTLHGGNYTEVYAIPFQFACLLFLVQSEQKGGFWPAFACGMALGIIFFLQQNLIGVGIAISLYLVLRAILSHSWKPFIQAVFIALGAISISIVFLAWMAIQGILPGFWDGAFVYGMVYSNLGLVERIKALGDTLQFFKTIPLMLISIPVWLLALFLLVRHGASAIIKILKNRWTGWVLLAGGLLSLAIGVGGNLLPGSREGLGLLQKAAIVLGVILTALAILQLFSLLPRLAFATLGKTTFHLSPASSIISAVAVLWYPLEVGMVTLSGRSYLHYYMALIAVCTLLFTLLADQVKKLLSFWKIKGVNILVALSWSIGIILTLIYNPINTMRVLFGPEGNENHQIWQTVRYIEANTQPDNKVLIWGAEPVINFLSNRSSPIRYTYVYTFYTKGYGGRALSAELLSDIQTKKPILIIYTGDTPFINITAEHKCVLPKQPIPAGMENVMKSICSNYYYAGNIESTGWKIYHIY
jgi:hypothetical protein